MPAVFENAKRNHCAGCIFLSLSCIFSARCFRTGEHQTVASGFFLATISYVALILVCAISSLRTTPQFVSQPWSSYATVVVMALYAQRFCHRLRNTVSSNKATKESGKSAANFTDAPDPIFYLPFTPGIITLPFIGALSVFFLVMFSGFLVSIIIGAIVYHSFLVKLFKGRLPKPLLASYFAAVALCIMYNLLGLLNEMYVLLLVTGVVRSSLSTLIKIAGMAIQCIVRLVGCPNAASLQDHSFTIIPIFQAAVVGFTWLNNSILRRYLEPPRGQLSLDDVQGRTLDRSMVAIALLELLIIVSVTAIVPYAIFLVVQAVLGQVLRYQVCCRASIR